MKKGAGTDSKAWIWIHEAIMREEGEMIGKLGGSFLRAFSVNYEENPV
jgi:hypothetical protein